MFFLLIKRKRPLGRTIGINVSDTIYGNGLYMYDLVWLGHVSINFMSRAHIRWNIHIPIIICYFCICNSSFFFKTLPMYHENNNLHLFIQRIQNGIENNLNNNIVMQWSNTLLARQGKKYFKHTIPLIYWLTENTKK